MACESKNAEEKNSKTKVATSSNLQVNFVDKEPGEEREEYEGIWKSKYGKLTIYRVTEQYLWFTYEGEGYSCDAVLM